MHNAIFFFFFLMFVQQASQTSGAVWNGRVRQAQEIRLLQDQHPTVQLGMLQEEHGFSGHF